MPLLLVNPPLHLPTNHHQQYHLSPQVMKSSNCISFTLLWLRSIVMTWNRCTHPPAETFYNLPMNNDVIQWSIFDYDGNHVDNLPNYNLNSTTSHSSTPISIPCNPLHTPQNHVCQKEPTNNKHFQKFYHRKLSGKSPMVS